MIVRRRHAASIRSVGYSLFLELRGCFIQGVLHRRPCRVHPGLHVLPCRFASRAHFVQLLVRGVAARAHGLELFVEFGTCLGAGLIAFCSQLIDVGIPFLDLRFHHREVFIFLAHGRLLWLGRTQSLASPSWIERHSTSHLRNTRLEICRAR